MAKVGRPALPREVQAAFWDGIDAGLGVAEAAAAARASRRSGFRWLRAAGGVRRAGPAPGAVSGRFLQLWEREEIAVGLAAGLSCRAWSSSTPRACTATILAQHHGLLLTADLPYRPLPHRQGKPRRPGCRPDRH